MRSQPLTKACDRNHQLKVCDRINSCDRSRVAIAAENSRKTRLSPPKTCTHAESEPPEWVAPLQVGGKPRRLDSLRVWHGSGSPRPAVEVFATLLPPGLFGCARQPAPVGAEAPSPGTASALGRYPDLCLMALALWASRVGTALPRRWPQPSGLVCLHSAHAPLASAGLGPLGLFSLPGAHAPLPRPPGPRLLVWRSPAFGLAPLGPRLCPLGAHALPALACA